MPFCNNKATRPLDGGDIVFLGILVFLGLACVCIIVLVYAEVISNSCS